jgi:hypothetical protein
MRYLKPKWNAIALSLAALFTTAAVAQQQQANPARPGTINYVEGAVSIDGQPLNSHSVGSAELNPGQVLTTGTGRAEVLLTPGVFLRVGRDSAVQMVSPDLINTRVRLDRGKAAVEVDQLYKQNDLQIAEDGVVTQLIQPGLYEFNAGNATVRTFDGKAAVFTKPDEPNHAVVVKASHAIVVRPAEGQALESTASFHPADKTYWFDRKQDENTDHLLAWSSLRSDYLAQANASMAEQYAGAAGFAPGWYWDPLFFGYTWLPGDGLFWNPFGWGFYSPGWFWGGGPYLGGGWGYGYGGYGYGGGVGRPYHQPNLPAGGFGGHNIARGGFHGGGGGFGGGGFHGGGGGFGGGGHGR